MGIASVPFKKSGDNRKLALGALAHLEERWFCKPEAVGSSPTGSTKGEQIASQQSNEYPSPGSHWLLKMSPERRQLPLSVRFV